MPAGLLRKSADADYVVAGDASTAAPTITLQNAQGGAGRIIIVKKTDSSANAVTASPQAGETIDGANTYALTAQWQGVRLISLEKGEKVVTVAKVVEEEE